MQDSLVGFTPVEVQFDAGAPRCRWVNLGGIRFKEPSFSQTLRRLEPLRNLEEKSRFLNRELLEEFKRIPKLEPQGFIFQMSRCGSTLLSQLLATSERSLVISEPTAINDLLLPRDENWSDDELILWLQILITALGQPPSGEEENYILKFRSWNLFYLPLILQAFPRVPWVFVYRDPVEVMVSAMRKRPAYFKAKASGEAGFLSRLHLEPKEVEAMSEEEYLARTLGEFCSIALKHLGSRGIAIDYRHLPGAVFEEVALHFNLRFSPMEVAEMKTTSRYYSKDPERAKLFLGDSEDKQRAASSAMRAAAERWVLPYIVQICCKHG